MPPHSIKRAGRKTRCFKPRNHRNCVTTPQEAVWAVPTTPDAFTAAPSLGFAGNTTIFAPASPTAQLDSLVSPTAFSAVSDLEWIADSGATSHMTPHRFWIKNYVPYRIPIHLADSTVIYSAGIGSVEFEPVLNGKITRNVEFLRVLHVPELRSNLLSCLYLTSNKDINITISKLSMDFLRDKTVLFRAGVRCGNTAVLEGTTISQPSQSASLASTLPLDLPLWHRRFIHHNYADIKQMVKKELVTGLKISSEASPDPICEPCLAGKMSANPFPPSTSHTRAPLELVHSDLHGPMPVITH